MKKPILIIFSVLVTLLFIEFFLKLLNFKSFQYIESNNSGISKPHKILGWVSKDGKNIIDHNKTIFKKVIYTYEKLGNRKTIIKKNNDKKSVLIFGGSFTQGWGVSDENTYSSKLQESLKNIDIYNFGHAGYSGYQSLLLMENKLKKIKSPRLVIYGFIEHHEQRNVARANWLRSLAQSSNKDSDKIPKLPYAILDKEKNFIRKSPINYTKFPFSEKFIAIHLIEKFYMKQKSKGRKKYQRNTTNEIFKIMKKLSLKNNSNFLVVILDWSNKLSNENYEKYLSKNNINFVNCKIEMNERTLLKKDYHPNELGHRMYKECILKFVKANKLLF